MLPEWLRQGFRNVILHLEDWSRVRTGASPQPAFLGDRPLLSDMDVQGWLS